MYKHLLYLLWYTLSGLDSNVVGANVTLRVGGGVGVEYTVGVRVKPGVAVPSDINTDCILPKFTDPSPVVGSHPFVASNP